MKNYALFLLLSIFFYSCSNDDNNETVVNPLEELNLLGTWEITSRSFDGITPLVVFCCEFMNYEDDSNMTDMTGNFTFIGIGPNSERTFLVDSSNNTITFTDNDGDQFIITFNIFDNNLSTSYTENGTVIVEDWIKVN